MRNREVKYTIVLKCGNTTQQPPDANNAQLHLCQDAVLLGGERAALELPHRPTREPSVVDVSKSMLNKCILLEGDMGARDSEDGENKYHSKT